MNRQAKSVWTETWRNYGAVTHAEAAELEARTSIGTFETIIETRDEATPEVVFKHAVSVLRVAEVIPLRGGS